jgi:hypothetical protein
MASSTTSKQLKKQKKLDKKLDKKREKKEKLIARYARGRDGVLPLISSRLASSRLLCCTLFHLSAHASE